MRLWRLPIPAIGISCGAMASVHEDMQKGTGKEQQPWPVAKDMCPMFSDQKKAGNRQKADQGDIDA
jgi:hypothetical protein